MIWDAVTLKRHHGNDRDEQTLHKVRNLSKYWTKIKAMDSINKFGDPIRCLNVTNSWICVTLCKRDDVMPHEYHGVSNHMQIDGLFSDLFGQITKKSMRRVRLSLLLARVSCWWNSQISLGVIRYCAQDVIEIYELPIVGDSPAARSLF